MNRFHTSLLLINARIYFSVAYGNLYMCAFINKSDKRLIQNLRRK